MIYANYPYFSRLTNDVGSTSIVQLVTKQHDAAYTDQVAKNTEDYFKSIGLKVTSAETIASIRQSVNNQFNIIVVLLLLMAVLIDQWQKILGDFFTRLGEVYKRQNGVTIGHVKGFLRLANGGCAYLSTVGSAAGASCRLVAAGEVWQEISVLNAEQMELFIPADRSSPTPVWPSPAGISTLWSPMPRLSAK